jgi:hypothetical protein
MRSVRRRRSNTRSPENLEAILSRLDTIARAFLRYLYEENQFRPEVAGFLDSPHARAQTPPITHAELAPVLARLRGYELIATSSGTSEGIPSRAGLTGAGLICVGNHGGDVEAWKREQTPASVAVLTQPERRSSPERRAKFDTQPIVTIVPAQARDRTVARAVTYAGLSRVANVVLLTLPTVQARYDEEDELIQQTAEKLLDATRRSNPDPGHVQKLALQLRTQLITGSVANTLGVVLLDGLDEALRESRLR